MKRAARLLSVVLAAWLLTLPCARAGRVEARLGVATATAGKSGVAVEQATARIVAPQIARAPFLARLPVVPSTDIALVARDGWLRDASRAPLDLREALRRVQTRRRLPRLNTEEPPWS